MADSIVITVDSKESIDFLNEALGKITDPRPLLERIGEDVLFKTKQRFLDEKGPDGSPWERLKASTLRQRRAGGVGAKILQDTRALFQSLQVQVNEDNVQVGTNIDYGKFHQFGTKNMVARPFLGADQDMEKDIVEITVDYLNEILEN